MTDAPRAQAGWYPDPTGRHEHRYWDGNAWTLDVADDGVPGIDARARTATAAPTTPETRGDTDTRSTRRPRTKVLVAAAIAAVAALVGFVLSSSVFSQDDARAEYPAGIEARFVRSCREGGSTKDACRCALDHIEEDYDLAEFSAASSEYDQTGVLPQKMQAAARDCVSEQSSQG